MMFSYLAWKILFGASIFIGMWGSISMMGGMKRMNSSFQMQKMFKKVSKW